MLRDASDLFCSMATASRDVSSPDIWVQLLLFPARPPRWRPTARSRLVTGWSRRGGPCAVTAGHAQSRRCGSRHGRHGRHGSKSPGLRPIPRHAGVARPRHACLRDQRCVRSVRRESQRPLEPSSAASPSGASLLTCLRRDPEVASTIQNVPRPTRPRCRAVFATPPAAPGSCPGGSQAIGQ